MAGQGNGDEVGSNVKAGRIKSRLEGRVWIQEQGEEEEEEGEGGELYFLCKMARAITVMYRFG